MSYFTAMEEAYGVRTVRACARILEKYAHLCSEVGSSRLYHQPRVKTCRPMTKEEADMMVSLHAKGMPNNEIARLTGRSWATVKTHLLKNGLKPHLDPKATRR